MLLGERLRNVVGDRIHVGLRLLNGYVTLEAAHREQPVKVMIQLFGLENQRSNQPLIEAVGLARRQHADNRIGRALLS